MPDRELVTAKGRVGEAARRGADLLRRMAEINSDENDRFALAIMRGDDGRLADLWAQRNTRDRHIERLANALAQNRLQDMDYLIDRAKSSDPLRLGAPHQRTEPVIEVANGTANGVAK